MTTLTRNFWLLDCTIDICICNHYKLFTDFVELSTALSRVTSIGVSPDWKTVSLMLVLKNGQVRAQMWMAHILYISQNFTSFITLYKFNKANLY